MEAEAAILLRKFPSSFWEGCGAKNKMNCKNNVSLCSFFCVLSTLVVVIGQTQE